MYYHNNDVRIQEMPKPAIGAKEILVKAMACGVCGSDVLEWYRVKKAPLVLGHEMAGIVEEVGSEVKKYQPGQRVFVSHHVPCDSCAYCLNNHHTACETLHTTNFYPGGFSEYVRIPGINVEKGVFVLPEQISFEEATFIEPLATVVRAQRLMGIQKNHSVLVLGCGIAGLLHVKLARAKGARVLGTNRGEFRRKTAQKCGAEVINGNLDVPSEVKKILGKGADFVIDCAGSLVTAKQALQSVDRGGTVLFFAVPTPGTDLPIPLNEFWRNEVKIMTSYGAVPYDLQESIELIRSGKIKVNDMITHMLPLEKAQEAFRLTAEAKDSLKVIIQPNGRVGG